MLYVLEPREEAYKELATKFKKEGGRRTFYRELRELCENCRSSSPIVCMDLCQIWKLKTEFREVHKNFVKPTLKELIDITKSDCNIKILEVLIGKPVLLKDLIDVLKIAGFSYDLNTLCNQNIDLLIKLGLVEEENRFCSITPEGRELFSLLKGELARVAVNIKGVDEDVLLALASSPKSYGKLTKIVPKGSLYRSLKRLQRGGLISRSKQSGRMFYFKAKRRPTRKLSPIEMKIFKALPKDGVGVKDLSAKVGISISTIYKYLRRLRYKRHVKKEVKAILYNITETGKHLIDIYLQLS